MIYMNLCALLQYKFWRILQDFSVIVPLLECLVISSSNLVKKEILSGLAIINSERFCECSEETVYYALEVKEREEFIKRILTQIENTQDEVHKAAYLLALRSFNEIELMHQTLIYLRTGFLQIQHVARENFVYLLNQPLPNGISTPEQINIIIQALDDFILYSRIDLNEFFNRFSITEIVKAYLCNPIVCSTRVQSYIAQRYTIDLAFISQIQSLEINMILKNFIQMERSPLTEIRLIVFLKPYSYPQ